MFSLDSEVLLSEVFGRVPFAADFSGYTCVLQTGSLITRLSFLASWTLDLRISRELTTSE